MAVGRTNSNAGGGAGATWTITGVVGATVTVTGNGKTYTKTIPASGKVEFKGLTAGTWTAKMSKSGETPVTITRKIDTNYSDTISFFSATIAVTYPAGSTCTCTNGSTTLTASGTSGSYTFTVPRAGTWTVKAVQGSKSTSKNVTITSNGQSVSVTLSYILVLFDASAGGDQTAVTGGWTTPNYTSISEKAVSASGSGYAGGGTNTTKKAIDITPYKTLKAIGTVSGVNSIIGVGGSWGLTGSANQSPQNGTNKEYSIDISAVNGEHTVYLRGGGTWYSEEQYIVTVSFTYIALLP